MEDSLQATNGPARRWAAPSGGWFRHRAHEFAAFLEEPLACAEEPAADEQHRVATVAREHLGSALDGHAAGGHRQYPLQFFPRLSPRRCRLQTPPAAVT